MAPRALRKIDPDLDLSGYLWPFEELPRPWEAEVLFDRRAPLEVEVGSGKGMFLSQASVDNPDHDFLGIEISPKYARYTASRLAKLGVPNAAVVQGDALRVFAEVFPPAILRAVHIYFPDPWWKKRHRKRRVIRPEFVADLLRGLEPEGVVHFWTDVEGYFEEARQLFRQGGLEELRATAEIRAPSAEEGGPLPEGKPPSGYLTHFERRMRLQAVPVYKAVYRKPTSSTGEAQNSEK